MGSQTVAARHRFRRATPLAGLVATLLVALACGAGVPLGGQPAGRRPASAQSGEPARSAPTATTARPADGTTSVEEFQRDVTGAVGLAERYWGERFPSLGRRFEPVAEVVAYTRDGEVTCGTVRLTRNNAAYCAPRDMIAYDARWAASAFRRVGDAFLFYLLGHEYAHGVQVRLGLQHRFTIQQELQADCLAGAYIGDSVRAKTLTLDKGDLAEFRAGLLAVGDDPGQPWFAEDAHGTAEQRTDAFFAGYDNSLAACDLE